MNKRAITSFLMLFSLVMLIPSGITLHVTSSDGGGPTRHLLMTIHNVSALILVVSASLHLVINWKTMVSYFKSKAAARSGLRKEAAVALIIVAVIIGAALLHIFLLG